MHSGYRWFYFIYICFTLPCKSLNLPLISPRFIPESARWLLTKGRHREAREWILKAAKINKRVVPDKLLKSVC